jgi:hypothetical protein
MAVVHAQQMIWSKEIETQLATITSLRNHCTFKYEKYADNAKKVKIIGVARPTINTYVPGTDISLEVPTDSELDLNLDQFKYFNFALDDTVKSQSIPGVMEMLSQEAARGLTEEGDKYVASIVKTAVETSTNPIASSTPTVVTKENAVEVVESGFAVLYANNCKISDTFHLEVSPKFFTNFRQSLTQLYTENVEMAKKGYIGKYGNAQVSIENLLPTDGADVNYNFLRNNKAIAFCEQINKVEKYRPEKAFSSALKGLYTFGALIVRPEQIYVIKDGTVSA